jgi:hypothetical protein
MVNAKVEEVGVLRPEVQDSEDHGGSPFEGNDVLYDDSASREALEPYAVSRGVASPEHYSTKKELRRALQRIVVADECAAFRSEAAANAQPVRSAAQPAALSVAMAELEADQMSADECAAFRYRFKYFQKSHSPPQLHLGCTVLNSPKFHFTSLCDSDRTGKNQNKPFRQAESLFLALRMTQPKSEFL